MNSFSGVSNKSSNRSSIPSKARRKVASKSSATTIPTSFKLFLNYSGISKTLQKMRLQHLSPRFGFQVVVSALLFLEWAPHTQGTPNPVPVVTPNSNDQGVYSLFPNEDLRTGRSNPRREEELRPLGVRNYPLEPYRDRDGRNTRFRDDYRRTSNYAAVTRPIEKYNQILFDDERLNYPARRDRDRFQDFRNSRYLDREPPVSYFNAYRNRDLIPYDRYRYRPGMASYLPQGSPRHFSRFNPLIVEPKYPPRPINPDDGSKARIHVFDPASRSFGENKPQNLPNVKPGRLLIPGYNSGSAEEPGPNVFLNHEEYLDFHTKKALAALDANEKKKKEEGGGSESEKRMRAKHLLFSPNIGGLRPPVPNSSEENSSGDENESSGDDKGKPEIKTQKIKGVVVKALAEPTKDDNKSGQNGQETGDKDGQKQPSEPLRLRGVPRSTSSPSPQDAQQHTKDVKLQLGPEVTTQTTAGGIITNSSPFPGNFISTITPTQNTFFSAVDHSGFTPVTETINFTPNTFPDLNSHNNALLGPSFRGETDSPPLIFLESQDGRSSKTGNSVDNKGKSINNGNMIFVRRVKPQTLVKTSNSSQSSKSGGAKSGKDVESSMKVHKSQADSFESSNDFNLQAESMSSTGVVSKVHAHISTCPKLHGAAEVICDVHIRKRHGSPNPHLLVGWKRKFHNATQPDIILALNKTLAYEEEDFHDKFNVTLAPGISPMLRSVLLIRHVAPPDTGNYQCEVFDGENRLKSDTLLFLCH